MCELVRPEKSQIFSTTFFLSKSFVDQSRTSMPLVACLEFTLERFTFISCWIRVVFPLPGFPTTMSFIRQYGTAFFSRCCRNLGVYGSIIIKQVLFQKLCDILREFHI